MITANLDEIIEQETGSAKFRIGQPVHVFQSINPYLVIDGRFNDDAWGWEYQISDGSDYWYTERSLKPFHKIRGEMKQLIRRV